MNKLNKKNKTHKGFSDESEKETKQFKDQAQTLLFINVPKFLSSLHSLHLNERWRLYLHVEVTLTGVKFPESGNKLMPQLKLVTLHRS